MVKYKVILLVLVALIIAGGYLWNTDPGHDMSDTEDEEDATQLAGMRAEENAIVVVEQKPNTSVVASIIHLSAPGYVVIHEDNNGKSGAIIGASTLLSAGESADITIMLSRDSRDGETLHAMLHEETGRNQTFSALEDTPVQSNFGGPISGWLVISADAPDTTFIVL